MRDGFVVDDDVTFNLVDGEILIGDISLPESQLLVRTSGDISTANGVTTKRAVFWKDISFLLASSGYFGVIHLC